MHAVYSRIQSLIVSFADAKVTLVQLATTSNFFSRRSFDILEIAFEAVTQDCEVSASV